MQGYPFFVDSLVFVYKTDDFFVEYKKSLYFNHKKYMFRN